MGFSQGSRSRPYTLQESWKLTLIKECSSYHGKKIRTIGSKIVVWVRWLVWRIWWWWWCLSHVQEINYSYKFPCKENSYLRLQTNKSTALCPKPIQDLIIFHWYNSSSYQGICLNLHWHHSWCIEIPLTVNWQTPFGSH